ncbi:MAG: hypothetical protein ACK46G_06140 [Flavobacteriales bacterium]|jgi:hypothetical protein
MKNLMNYIFPVALILIGLILLVVGGMQGQNAWVMLGAGLALFAGVVALLLQMGIISRSTGLAIGLLCAVVAGFLGYRNYRSIAEVLENEEKRKKNDSLVIQALKDIRTAEIGYRQATGAFTGNLEVLRDFVKNGSIPMVRSIGQVPDSLTEKDALALKIIVRDTIMAPALDSLFRTANAMEGRVYPFDPEKFTTAPTSGKPFILRNGAISSSGRNVPVFIAKDPQPFPGTDTLMVGSMEKATTAGNWKGE